MRSPGSLLSIFLFLTFAAVPSAGSPEEAPPPAAGEGVGSLPEGFRGISLSGQWFLAYRAGETGGEEFNEFALRRGYITLKKNFSDSFSGRITQDISVDREGDGRGDVEMRLRYCYVRYRFPDTLFLTNPFFEFGLVHRPWLDFEQQVNPYRVQGTMFLERVGVISSADYGITGVALFGGQVDEGFRNRGNRSYPGRYGSLSVGLYNGGGYHAIEENPNKTVEGRLTVRPLPDRLPGLQISAHGAVGKGNVAEAPDWEYAGGFLSFEDERVILTAMVIEGTGDYSGKEVDESGKALGQDGFSLFADLKPWPWPVSLFGRYDEHERRTGDGRVRGERVIAGIAYRIPTGGQLIVDYDRFDSGVPGEPVDRTIETAVEVLY